MPFYHPPSGSPTRISVSPLTSRSYRDTKLVPAGQSIDAALVLNQPDEEIASKPKSELVFSGGPRQYAAHLITTFRSNGYCRNREEAIATRDIFIDGTQIRIASFWKAPAVRLVVPATHALKLVPSCVRAQYQHADDRAYHFFTRFQA